jgi:lipopolysaccharide/colanic/teichoic acid biosynthesis glycosyltransferase
MRSLINRLVALVGLILVSPLLLLVGAALFIQDRGPMLYLAKRTGKLGRQFSLLKFRSMIVNADAFGPGLTTKGDARITPIGRILRKTKIDELPQLINVIKGDMEFVGARPEDPRYLERYTSEERKILSYLPGITSPASIAFRREEELLSGENSEETYFADILPAKLAIDLAYLKQRTLISDVRIVMQTIGAVVGFERKSRAEMFGPSDSPNNFRSGR